MGLFASIIYGFVSGLTEILPVSAQANQMVMRQLFGVAHKEPIRDLLVHIAVLAALFLACRGMINKIRREQVLAYRLRRNPSQVRALKGVYDMRLVRSAAPIMCIGIFLGVFMPNFYDKRLLFSLVLILNGVLNLVPAYMHHGNRDARSMSGADGMLIGLAAAFSAVPGISRNGAIMAMTLFREADKRNGVTWGFLLSIPALIVLLVLDFVSMFTIGIGTITLLTVGGYFLSAIAAFAGTYLAVIILMNLIARSDYSGFAFYDFGLALFSFVLYLIA